MKHPHIVKFIRHFVHAGTVNIVMQYAARGTLRGVLNSVRLSKVMVTEYFCDILMGLEYLHIRHVMHRDLKPENLLISDVNKVLIADFGISAIHNPNTHLVEGAGTLYYCAPEVMKAGEKYDFKADIWSLGCVLYEMCMGYSPFQQAQSSEELAYLIKVLTTPKMNCTQISKTYGPAMGRIVERMLMPNQYKRASLAEIICLDPVINLKFYRKYFEYDY